ncbi:MAG: PqqD family peptide modification chaperone [Magnetococcales bacterium]|nr:PqqD family peptide modification chaperone [Magnetococcales bacterium]
MKVGNALLENLTYFYLDDGVVVFFEDDRRLFGLNSTAALIFLSMADGLSWEQIVQQLVDHFAIPIHRASQDVMALLDVLADKSISGCQEDRASPIFASSPLPFNQTADASFCYRLSQTQFHLQGDEELLNHWLIPVLHHLQEVDRGQLGQLIQVGRGEEERCWLRINHTLIGENYSPSHLLPLLHDSMIRTLCQTENIQFAFHAGVVNTSKGALMLAGPSGRGKTTLTAGLAAQGFPCLSDESALITETTHHVIPIPLKMNAKSGSWPILSAYYETQLAQARVYQLPDGRQVKYLSPLVAEQPYSSPLAAIMFPHYRAGATARMTPISRSLALHNLAMDGYYIRGNLNRHSVAEMVDWIRPLPCLELEYDSLADAIRLINNFFSNQDTHNGC